jgi:hypothetical protein
MVMLLEHLPIFADTAEVHLAYGEGAYKIHQRIRLKNPDRGSRYGVW